MPRDFRQLICIRRFADDRNAIIAVKSSLESGGPQQSVADWSQLANEHAKKLIGLKFPAFHGSGQLRFIMMMVFGDVGFIECKLVRAELPIV